MILAFLTLFIPITTLRRAVGAPHFFMGVRFTPRNPALLQLRNDEFAYWARKREPQKSTLFAMQHDVRVGIGARG